MVYVKKCVITYANLKETLPPGWLLISRDVFAASARASCCPSGLDNSIPLKYELVYERDDTVFLINAFCCFFVFQPNS